MKFAEVRDLITALTIMKPAQRRAFFELATPKQICVIEEVFLNLLKNPRGLSKQHLATAKRYARRIKRLADYKTATQTKRRILCQRGGFLGALLPILGTLLASFIQ